ncbi:MAG TPA: HIT family protein [Candidatus Paceibacterota bacterium]|nr:HIT family protein [Candidatus Paceibacterota bacterium]
MDMKDCVFCKIVAGEIPSFKVVENDLVFAFLDIHPANAGHTLVIPKRHAENIFETTEEEWLAMSSLIWLLSAAIEKATESDGLTIKMNNREHGGQDVMHAHVHIIPRFKGDGVVKPIVQKSTYKGDEAHVVLEKIRKAL